MSGTEAEQKLIDTRPTMSVITSATIEIAPSANFAELLRTIPGVNITQVSARDINVTSRAATGTLATGQLALLDGRTLYQDFFGFVMWDFLPVNFDEVKQVEVIRGPASAVWGANALYGVVNVISKSPRELQGTSAMSGFGGFDRPDADAGSALVRQRHLRRRIERSLVLQAFRRRLFPGPPGSADRPVPCDRPWSASVRGTVIPRSATPARPSPRLTPGSTTTTTTVGKLSFSGGASGNHKGSCTPALGPSRSPSGSVMGYAKANLLEGRLSRRVFHQHPATAMRTTC